MSKSYLLIFFTLGFLACSTPQRVILDTDIDSDVDDVQALAMLHAYERQQLVDLTGVIVTSTDTYSYRCADAINTFYGKTTVPIGFLKGQDNLRNFSKYTRQISENFKHSLRTIGQTTEAARQYRELLSKSADNSVVLVTIGHLTSFQNLLRSEPDDLSELNGTELAHKKIKKWLCMGGKFPEGKEANFFRPDPGSTVYCLDNWRKEVLFCGWEVGNRIITGGDYLKSHLSEDNPVYLGYKLYNEFAGRPAWDQVAVALLDSKAAKRFFSIDKNGIVEVAPDGSNTWAVGKSSPSKKHGIIKIRTGIAPDSIARYMDNLTLTLQSDNETDQNEP